MADQPQPATAEAAEAGDISEEHFDAAVRGMAALGREFIGQHGGDVRSLLCLWCAVIAKTMDDHGFAPAHDGHNLEEIFKMVRRYLAMVRALDGGPVAGHG